MFWLLLLILPYAVIILFAWIKLRKEAEVSSSVTIEAKNLPKVSLIIAARNEESNLPSLIRDLQKLEYPTEKLEVFIVDDNSSDRSAEIIKQSTEINYLLSSGKGKKQAIAKALQQSKGELIITTDADCNIPPGWLLLHAQKYTNENADMIIGEVRTIPGKGCIRLFSDLEYYSLQAVTRGLALAGLPIMCNGANLSFRREAVPDYLDAVRSNLSSGDDMFLLHYMKKNKKKICLLNHGEGRAETRMPDRAASVLRQRSRWTGKGYFYKDIETILLALFTLLANLSLLAAIVILALNTSFVGLFAGCYLLKSIPEFLLLSAYLENPGKRLKLIAYLPLSLVYPVYVLLVGFISIFRTNRW